MFRRSSTPSRAKTARLGDTGSAALNNFPPYPGLTPGGLS